MRRAEFATRTPVLGVGAENRVTLCDLREFVDASTEAIAAKDVKTTAGFWDRSSTRWRLTEREVPRVR
jgi:hypothetical protein